MLCLVDVGGDDRQQTYLIVSNEPQHDNCTLSSLLMNGLLLAATSKTLGKRKRMMEASSRRKMWGDGRKRVRTPTPPPPSACSVCNIMPPNDKLLTCKECGLSVHS